MTRRDFLKFLGVAALEGLALSAGGLAYAAQVEPNWVEVNTVRLRLPRLGKSFDGLRLAQLSDIHMGGWMNLERFEHVVDLTLAEKPDMVLISGDFVYGRTFTPLVRDALRDLRSALPRLALGQLTFAVLGNHDYWTDPQAVRAMLADCSIRDLTNDFHTLVQGDEQFHIAGVDDVWEGEPALEDILSHLPDDGAAILLAHEPDFADASAETGRFDLQVSGHSHGGQVVLPWIGPPVVPYLGQKYPLGLYQVRNMYQYTNRGVGMIDPPVRFNCRPEITIFSLEAG